jgi:hypothetical protein
MLILRGRFSIKAVHAVRVLEDEKIMDSNPFDMDTKWTARYLKGNSSPPYLMIEIQEVLDYRLRHSVCLIVHVL